MNGFNVHFPWMHPRLATGPFPADLVFLNPGLPIDGDEPRWRPVDLPCTDQEVRTLLRAYFEFAERFPRVSDMQAYWAAGLDNFYTDSVMDIRSRLTDFDSTQAPAREQRPVQAEKRQAQLLLAMTLFREEQFALMAAQQHVLARARDGLAQSLGLEDEDSFMSADLPDAALFPCPGVTLPWRETLPRMLLFLPSDATIFVSDPDVVRALSLELSFQIHDPDTLLVCRASADDVERVCGTRVELARPLTILARNPAIREDE